MLAKTTWDAFSARMGCRAVKKTCTSVRGQRRALRRPRDSPTHLDNELQALHICLLSRDELKDALLTLALSVTELLQGARVNQA